MKKKKKTSSLFRADLKKERWQSVQSHLDQALNQWNEISVITEGQISPDKKHMNEVKDLLQDLKGQLDQF